MSTQERIDVVAEVLRRRWQGETYAEIARACNLGSPAQAHQMLRGVAGPTRGQVRAARSQRRNQSEQAGELTATGRRRRTRPADLVARDREICTLRGQGATLEEISGRYGLTRERVRQIVDRDGVDLIAQPETATDRELQRLADLTEKIHHSLTGDGPGTLAEVAARVGCSIDQVRLAISDADRRLLLREKPVVQKYDDQSILAGLRAMSRQRARERDLGENLAPVSYAYWDTHRDPATMPTSVRVMQRFKSWNEACHAAGIPYRAQMVRSGPAPRWTDEDCRGWVVRFVNETDGSTSYANFDAWLRTQDGAPSSQTVRNRLGGWNSILRSITPLLSELDTAA